MHKKKLFDSWSDADEKITYCI